jgi:uncharacterized membrane protein
MRKQQMIDMRYATQWTVNPGILRGILLSTTNIVWDRVYQRIFDHLQLLEWMVRRHA